MRAGPGLRQVSGRCYEEVVIQALDFRGLFRLHAKFMALVPTGLGLASWRNPSPFF